MDIQSDSFLLSMNKIDKNLFISGILGASNPANIARNQISAVVSVLGPSAYLTKHRNVRYLELTIEDLPSENITTILPEALNFIQNELSRGSNVLIHCAAGVSRSASVAIAHFMVTYNMSYDQALHKVRQGRHCACPNPGFERQLRSLDKKAFARITHI